MPVSSQTLYITPVLTDDGWRFNSDGVYPDPEGTPYVPEYYLPTSLTWISWDAPLIGHTGIDLDYKMTGYDWFNRELTWSLVSPPAGATIDADGTLHWTPSVEAEQSFTVRMTVGGANYDKTFTCDVDNSRCVFVATDGDDSTGDGTSGNPYLTLEKALDDTVVSGSAGVTNKLIFIRAGTYVINDVNWNSATPGTGYRKVTSAAWPESIPLFIRGYPSETATFSFTGTSSGFMFGSRANISNLKLSGGFALERAGLEFGGTCVAKNVEVYDYQGDADGNCTGIKSGGGCIFDMCYSHDNYERADAGRSNNSNWLQYGTYGEGETFIIDCISSGGSSGFKIKHAGSVATVHYHRCVGFNDRTPFAAAQDHASVRHSLFYKALGSGDTTDASGYATLAFGSTDPTTGGIKNNGGGMLADTCLVISDDSTSAVGLYQASHAFNDEPENPAYYINNVVQNATNNIGAGFESQRYNALPEGWTAIFTDNEFIAPNASNLVRLGNGAGLTVETLNGYGSGNTHTVTTREHTITCAGSDWVHVSGVLTRDGSPV